ncbi:MAG: competence protein CoiA family protein [Prevotellaceae bacterium]|nr:competence protein CoiA family protein [Prevotellaceae bacterium]
MGNIINEPKLTYALDSSGRMVSIHSVTRGLSCNCFCPKCKEALVARIGQGKRQPHFAHQKDSDCSGSYMTALHKLAEQIIEEEKKVMVPAYNGIKEQKLLFEKVEVEKRVERKDLQPDLIGETSDGLRWHIEIRNTHEVDDTKRDKIEQSNITCLEIDVRKQTLENLKDFIINSTESRKWINNPIYDYCILELNRKKIDLIENYFKNISNIILPDYADFGSTNISINSFSTLNISEDFLFMRATIKDAGNMNYILDFGYHDTLEKYKSTYDDPKDCCVLNIYIDQVSTDSNDISKGLDIRWSYRFFPNKEKENHIKRNKSILDYSIKKETNEISSVVDHDISEYYKLLKSSGIYETENGEETKVICCDLAKNGCGIIVLNKGVISSRSNYPFHISLITIKGCKLSKSTTEDYFNLRNARQTYGMRLNRWEPIIDNAPFESITSIVDIPF